MKEIKDTLNLPQTDFPMKANLSQREPSILNFWAEKAVYQTLRKVRHGQKKFMLNDGPPYANGHLHCGHALNKILKDIIMKSHTLSGYDVPYVPGWDCHGLPIELNVEKKWGKAGVKLSKEAFREKCREYAREQISIQREEFKRLGIMGDWDHPYATMDFAYEADIIRALSKIIQKGYLVRGFKPVHWCMDCQSALAEAEVEYEDKTSPAIDVQFVFENVTEFNQRLGVNAENPAVIIWTTTPWTLPANEAVALNGKIRYACIKAMRQDSHGTPVVTYWLLAYDLVDNVMSRYGITEYKIISEILGKSLEGLRVQHPLYNNKYVPIVLGDHVTTEAGTGAVHTAPSHGPDDYLIGKQYNLPLECPVIGSGHYASTVPLLAGEHVSKADSKIINLLKEHHALVHFDAISHSYPHCWRHKTPVIFRSTAQWFLTFDRPGLREKMLAAVDATQWIPEWGNIRMRKMLEHRPDWCISRQRSWGTPITLLIHKETQDIHPDMASIMEHVAKKIETDGIAAWFAWDPKELLGENAEQYEKVEDTLDVWFDAGVAHECVLKRRPELTYPADIYVEGSDQYRGWFNSSLVTSVMLNDEAPFKTVLSHGFTVDAEGKKMSKSRGNYITPQEVVRDSGADILRLWAASSDYRAELTLSDEVFKRVSDAYRRIRNTARFLLSNLADFDFQKDAIATEKLTAIDQWLLFKTAQLQTEIIEAYKTFQFHVIYQKLHNFCAVDLGSFYLDIIKDRQYTAKKDSAARRSSQTVMFHILEALVRWLAPILSFTAEEIWQHLPKEGREASVFFHTWYDHPAFTAILAQEKSLEQYQWASIMQIRESVNKALETERAAGTIGSSLAADLTFYADRNAQKMLAVFGDELRFIFLTSSTTIKPIADKPATALPVFDDNALFLAITPSHYEKCERCWHRREEVGHIADHSELCHRCVINIEGPGETRHFA